MTDGTHVVRTAGDIASAGIALGALLKFLPPLAALLSIIWYSVLLYDRFTRRKHDSKDTKQ